eukprot:m.327599 g.327599  ORF g.327599 m.327599 type:complete len:546 (-) comp20416_c0_seq2:286-1923(-)
MSIGHSKGLKRAPNSMAEIRGLESVLAPFTCRLLFKFVYLFSVIVSSTAVKPHLLFILVDDYGYGDIGYHNILADGLLSTPHLDLLAGGGIKLEQYYVQPICTPTRSQLLTGRYQIHTGLQHGVIHPQMPSGVPTDMPLISNQLQSLGYRTHLVGKWHVGFYNNASCPWNRGFDTTLGYLGGEEDYWTHVRSPGFDFRRNGVPDHEDATEDNGNTSKYSTKLFRNEAIDLIQSHSSTYGNKTPMFLYLPFQAVHSPLQATEHWLSLQHPLEAFNGSTARRTLAAMVSNMDFAVGKIVAELRNAGMWNNTIVILSADNGGISPGGFNYPLRGQKATLWEGGVRVNGFIHSPLLTTTGFTYNGLVHISDWYPTLMALGGGSPETLRYLDGFNVWHAVTTNSSSPRSELLHNIDIFNGLGPHGVGNAAIRVGTLKLLVGAPGTGSWYIPPGCTTCRTPSLRTFFTSSKVEMCAADSGNTTLWLFDVVADPRETCNLAVARPADAARLLARLLVYNASQVPVVYPPNDPNADPALRHGIERGCWGPWLP